MTNLGGHQFGGNWTERKLEAVRYYLEFYATALSKTPFELWYIDAFAGSGERTETRGTGGILEQMPLGTDDVVLDGSAKRAMAVTPPFKHLIFIEPDTARYDALCKLRDLDPRVECLQGDANQILPDIFSRDAWRRTAHSKGKQRGVVFLDPYGMQVAWETLRLLSETKRVDVWYLFPLGAVVRKLARKASAIDQHKETSLNRIFGDSNWRKDLYAPDPNMTLFDRPDTERRTASSEQIEAYFHRKLENLFSWASPSLPLFLDGGQQLFSIFLLVANDSPRAIQLAKNGTRDLLKKHERRAFRRRSVL